MTETTSEVVAVVRSFRVPFVPASGVGIPIEFVITLGTPLGERTVVDASDGHAVPKTRCLSYRPLCP